MIAFLRTRSGRGRKISWKSVRWWKGQIDVDKLIGLVAISERGGHGLGRGGNGIRDKWLRQNSKWIGS